MSDAWIIVAVVGVATVACKAAGPVLIGQRSLPRHVQPVVDLLAPVMLIALVIISLWVVAPGVIRARLPAGRD